LEEFRPARESRFPAPLSQIVLKRA
jgi:hypothetical protein